MTAAATATVPALDTPMIEVDHASKWFGDVVAVSDVSFRIGAGVTALLGPNGAGKSTTIGVISSLVNKSAGKVKVFGHDIDTDLELAKAQLGLVPQEFNFSQFEKVSQIVTHQAGFYGVPSAEAKVRAEKYLRQLDLWDKRDMAARTLSGGMKRRLMIARALMHEPRLLILDEPTNHLDVDAKDSLKKALQEYKGSILLICHEREFYEALGAQIWDCSSFCR